MNPNDADENLKLHAQHAMDQEIAELSSEELDRLAQARQSALAKIPIKGNYNSGKTTSRDRKPLWLSTSAVVAFSILVGVLFFTKPSGVSVHPPVLVDAQPQPIEVENVEEIEDLEVLLSGVELELLEEELEFYSWAEEELSQG